MKYDEQKRPLNDAGVPLGNYLATVRDQLALFEKKNPSRELSIAITKIDEAFMWLNMEHFIHLMKENVKDEPKEPNRIVRPY